MLKLPYTVVYVTRDIERALGVKPEGNYFIVSNYTSYGYKTKKLFPENVFLTQNIDSIDTYDLLSSPETLKLISKTNSHLVVFQNNSRIERFAKEKNWLLVNPKAELSKIVEEKVSQIEWLGKLTSYLPPHEIKPLKDIKIENKDPIVLQFNHAHTGQGTYIIYADNKLNELKKRFPDRPTRKTKFIDGPVFTVNAVVGDDVLVGNISYQITGITPFTNLPFSTIGNDWELPYKILEISERNKIEEIAKDIGLKLKSDNWKGLFGIDVIQDKETKKIYLLEINARQPASTTFESQLQKEAGSDLNIFEAHLSALLDISIKSSKIQKIKSGAQIIQRKTQDLIVKEDVLKKLEEKSFNVITYENTELNKDLLRIQTRKSFMDNHNILSALGETVRDIIKTNVTKP